MKIWAMTTGEAGMRAQALGLADALGAPYEEKTIRLKAPWRWLSAGAAPGALSDAALNHDENLRPPWPRLLISCGRRSAIVAAAIKRQAGADTFAVCVGDPRSAATVFDMVIVQPHDRLRGANVLLTETSLHRFSQERLEAGRERALRIFGDLARPHLGVLVGGPVKGRGFPAEDGARLAAVISNRLNAQGGSALITVSRRTRPEIINSLVSAFGKKPDAFLWVGDGENPYSAILASADRLIVTGDSVTMASEALATGAPVEIFEVSGAPRRQKLFNERIAALGLATPISLINSQQSYTIVANSPLGAVSPCDAASFVAHIIRERFKGIFDETFDRPRAHGPVGM